MRTFQTILVALTISVLLFSGCKKDDPKKKSIGTIGSLSSGVFISCEGKFMGGTGSVSFFDRNNGNLYNDLFYTVNGFPLGNIVQSVTIYNGKGFIPVNNANKMEVVDAGNFISKATVTGLDLPRYFMGIDNGKGYLSQWGLYGGDGSVKVIDLNTNTVSKTISTGKGAEHMLLFNNKVYVACNGGYDTDSVVNIIDPATDAVVNSIVAGTNPAFLQIDANGKLWVLCIGKWKSDYSALEQTGKLVKVDLSTNTVEASLPLVSTYSQPANFVINAAKTKLYYTFSGGVYSQDVNSSSLNSVPDINRSFYGLDIDPANDYIYATDPGNYSSGGWVVRYNSSHAKVDSFKVDIGPGNFFFK